MKTLLLASCPEQILRGQMCSPHTKIKMRPNFFQLNPRCAQAGFLQEDLVTSHVNLVAV